MPSAMALQPRKEGRSCFMSKTNLPQTILLMESNNQPIMTDLVQQTAIILPIRTVISYKHVQGFCDQGQDPTVIGSDLCDSLHLPTHLFRSHHSVYDPKEGKPQVLEEPYWTVRNTVMLPTELNNLFAFVPAVVVEDVEHENRLGIGTQDW